MASINWVDVSAALYFTPAQIQCTRVFQTKGTRGLSKSGLPPDHINKHPFSKRQEDLSALDSLREDSIYILSNSNLLMQGAVKNKLQTMMT